VLSISRRRAWYTSDGFRECFIGPTPRLESRLAPSNHRVPATGAFHLGRRLDIEMNSSLSVPMNCGNIKQILCYRRAAFDRGTQKCVSRLVGDWTRPSRLPGEKEILPSPRLHGDSHLLFTVTPTKIAGAPIFDRFLRFFPRAFYLNHTNMVAGYSLLSGRRLTPYQRSGLYPPGTFVNFDEQHYRHSY